MSLFNEYIRDLCISGSKIIPLCGLCDKMLFNWAQNLSENNFSTFLLFFLDNVPYLRFAFCAVIDGIQYKTGIGTTKKQARHSAAELALQEFLPTLEGCSHPGSQG